MLCREPLSIVASRASSQEALPYPGKAPLGTPYKTNKYTKQHGFASILRFLVRFRFCKVWLPPDCSKMLPESWLRANMVQLYQTPQNLKAYCSHADLWNSTFMVFDTFWESVFCGGLWFLGNPQDSKKWSSKNTKIPSGSNVSWKSQRFKNMIVQKYQNATRIQNYHLEIPKIQNMDRPKIPRFHADPKLWKMVNTYPKIFLI